MSKQKSNRDVKRNNRIHTFKTILNAQSISQPEIANKLHHSIPTVMQNVKELMERGLIEEVGTLESTGGRKAKAYAPVTSKYFFIGMDITKDQIDLVLLNICAEVVSHQKIAFSFHMTQEYFTQLGQSIRDFIAAYQPEQIQSVGIALPAIIAYEKITDSHVLHLKNVLTDNFRQAIDFPCSFLNDANAAAYSEAQQENIVYLSLSNSVGGAVISNQQLYLGNQFRAGEFGHITLIPDGKRCYCGKQGCVDAYCSAQQLSKHTNGDLSLFFDKLRKKEPFICEIWKEYIRNLSIIVHNLYMTFDCNIVIGGYVGSFLEEFCSELKQALIERNPFETDASYLKFGRYQFAAPAIGAAIRERNTFIDEMI